MNHSFSLRSEGSVTTKNSRFCSILYMELVWHTKQVFCIVFCRCRFCHEVPWPLTIKLVASAAPDKIVHSTKGVHRSLALSIRSPGWKLSSCACKAERRGREESESATQRYKVHLPVRRSSEDGRNQNWRKTEAISPSLVSDTKLSLNGKIMEVASLAPQHDAISMPVTWSAETDSSYVFLQVGI